MDEARFDAVARGLVAASSRRGLPRLLGGAVLGGPLALLGLVEAGSKKKRRKKKRRGPADSPTCAEQCGGCPQCFNRPVGPPICGLGWSNALQSCAWQCTTDTDCLGTTAPYCTVSRTNSLEETSRWGCGDYPVGICTHIIACR